MTQHFEIISDRKSLRAGYLHKALAGIFSMFIPLTFQAQTYSAFAHVPQEQARMTHVFDPICKQASFICEKHLICLSNDGHAIAYPLFSTADSVTFDLDCVKYTPHCNVANLVKKGKKNYLYTSEWNNQRRFFVEDIAYDKKQDKWTSRLIQTISMDIPDSIAGAGFTDWIVDAKNNKLYAHTYLEGIEGNDRVATGVILLEFNLPSRQEKQVVLHSADILRRAAYPMFYVTQDKEIHNGKMYIMAGLRTSKKKNWDFSRKMFVINLKNLEVEKIYDFAFYFDEPEGIDFYKGKTYITFRRGTYILK